MEYLPYLAISITMLGAVWRHAVWLANKFEAIKKDSDIRFDKVLETITEKLEYHERHDDRRFSEISNSIWEVRLQTALGYKANPREGREAKASGE
jgi:hypothetical protein